MQRLPPFLCPSTAHGSLPNIHRNAKASSLTQSQILYDWKSHRSVLSREWAIYNRLRDVHTAMFLLHFGAACHTFERTPRWTPCDRGFAVENVQRSVIIDGSRVIPCWTYYGNLCKNESQCKTSFCTIHSLKIWMDDMSVRRTNTPLRWSEKCPKKGLWRNISDPFARRRDILIVAFFQISHLRLWNCINRLALPGNEVVPVTRIKL